MKQTKNRKKQQRDVGRELQVMLKRSLNTKVPIIIDTPPQAMVPKTVHLTADELEQYNFEMLNCTDMNLTPIGQARENIRFNRAINAFRQAGVAANTYTHIGYYQVPSEAEEEVKKYKYFLLW